MKFVFVLFLSTLTMATSAWSANSAAESRQQSLQVNDTITFYYGGTPEHPRVKLYAGKVLDISADGLVTYQAQIFFEGGQYSQFQTNKNFINGLGIRTDKVDNFMAGQTVCFKKLKGTLLNVFSNHTAEMKVEIVSLKNFSFPGGILFFPLEQLQQCGE